MAGPKNRRGKGRGKPKMSRSQLRASVAASNNDAHASPASASRKRKAETELSKQQEEPDTQMVFEDPYGDDFEQEEQVEDVEQPRAQIRDPMMVNDAVVFRPGKDKIAAGEKLVYDQSAYDQFHRFTTEWPSLSFDFVCTDASDEYSNISPLLQQTYPMSTTLVLGSQADAKSKNKLVCLKVTNMHRTTRLRKGKPTAVKTVGADGESSDDSSDDEDDEEESDEDENNLSLPSRNPVLQNVDIKFDSVANRVRTMPQHPNVVAVWSSSGRFYVIDVAPALDVLSLDSRRRMRPPNSISPSNIKPMYSFRGHGMEGYAMDWSRVVEGHLLTGALNGSMYLTQPSNREGAAFTTSPDRYNGHRQPVEDIQWSPNEQNVFASCSSDKSIRIWDIRERRRSALGIEKAHDADVNVISWNRNETHLIVSGGDEGLVKVWDMRALTTASDGAPRAAAEFNQHTQAITSVQWNPTDSSMLCVSSEDGTVSIWDLAVERDAEEELREGVVLSGADEFPPQLLFMHMGQKNVKEAQWDPSCPSLIVSTAEDGLNLFQPSNITSPA